MGQDNNDSDVLDIAEEKKKDDKSAVFTVFTSPFFGPDKKYGTCPICAAVIIKDNKDTEAKCPNCNADLRLS